MGNAVAPAPSPSSGPVNDLLATTAELDPSTIQPLPASMPRSSVSESKSSSPEAHPHTSVDIADSSLLDDLLPQQLLFYAADAGDCDLIRKAIERGANVSAPDLGLKAHEEEKRAADAQAQRKKTATQLKAEKEREAVYKDLIITRDSALHKAAAKGHLEALDLLFYLEADVEAKNVLGSTPLHRAVSARQAGAVKSLLTKGARVDAVNAIGNSALHIAAYQGDVEIAGLLLSQGKMESYRLVVAINQAGLSPFDYARKKPMQQLLSSHRLAISHTSSFAGYHDPHTGTPKHGTHVLGEGVLMGAMQDSLGGEAAGFGSARALHRFGSSELSAAQSIPHSERSHHHHVPNPPLANQSASRSSTNHALAASQSSEPQPLASHTSHAEAVSASSVLMPASSGVSDAGVSSSLPMRPSFEKAPSLDSHVVEEDAEEDRSVVGSMVNPVQLDSCDGKVRAVSGARLSALSVHVLPNECISEAVEECKESEAQIQATAS